MPIHIHYTFAVFNINNDILNFKKGSNIFQDGLLYDGHIIEIKENFNMINQFFSYIKILKIIINL